VYPSRHQHEPNQHQRNHRIIICRLTAPLTPPHTANHDYCIMDSQSSSRLTRQPFKFLYGTFLIITLPIRLVFILFYYIPRPLRQNPRWTYHQAIGLEIFLIWWKYTNAVHYRTSKSLAPGSLKDRFIVIPPSSTKPSMGEHMYLAVVERWRAGGALWFLPGI
jgi:hypothetical protein